MQHDFFYDGYGNKAYVDSAPSSYILHGTIDEDYNVTLTNFDWDELVAAITEKAYVVAQMTDSNGSTYEFPLSVHYVDDGWVTFTCGNYFGAHGFAFDVEFDETITSYPTARTEPLTFHYEDGRQLTIEVYVK